MPCAFCKNGEIEICGKLWRIKDKNSKFSAHQKCMQYSSGLTQLKLSTFGGFHVEDVEKEILRGKKLTCDLCKRRGATASCALPLCIKSFHFVCLYKNPTTIVDEEIEENGCNVFRIFCGIDHKDAFTAYPRTSSDNVQLITQSQNTSLLNNTTMSSDHSLNQINMIEINSSSEKDNQETVMNNNAAKSFSYRSHHLERILSPQVSISNSVIQFTPVSSYSNEAPLINSYCRNSSAFFIKENPIVFMDNFSRYESSSQGSANSDILNNQTSFSVSSGIYNEINYKIHKNDSQLITNAQNEALEMNDFLDLNQSNTIITLPNTDKISSLFTSNILNNDITILNCKPADSVSKESDSTPNKKIRRTKSSDASTLQKTPRKKVCLPQNNTLDKYFITPVKILKHIKLENEEKTHFVSPIIENIDPMTNILKTNNNENEEITLQSNLKIKPSLINTFRERSKLCHDILNVTNKLELINPTLDIPLKNCSIVLSPIKIIPEQVLLSNDINRVMFKSILSNYETGNQITEEPSIVDVRSLNNTQDFVICYSLTTYKEDKCILFNLAKTLFNVKEDNIINWSFSTNLTLIEKFNLLKKVSDHLRDKDNDNFLKLLLNTTISDIENNANKSLEDIAKDVKSNFNIINKQRKSKLVALTQVAAFFSISNCTDPYFTGRNWLTIDSQMHEMHLDELLPENYTSPKNTSDILIEKEYEIFYDWLKTRINISEFHTYPKDDLIVDILPLNASVVSKIDKNISNCVIPVANGAVLLLIKALNTSIVTPAMYIYHLIKQFLNIQNLNLCLIFDYSEHLNFSMLKHLLLDKLRLNCNNIRFYTSVIVKESPVSCLSLIIKN